MATKDRLYETSGVCLVVFMGLIVAKQVQLSLPFLVVGLVALLAGVYVEARESRG